MSSNEIMLALSNEVEQSDRYQEPSLFSSAGVQDRRHEQSHVLAVRDYERSAREEIAGTAAEVAADMAWIQGRARVVSEAKYAIDRAQKETEVIGQGDPEKLAKFGILDDELFGGLRLTAKKPRHRFGNRLFE
jgi:hypothetical protein